MRVVNASGLPDSVISKAVMEVASAMESWRDPNETSPLSMFTRGTFVRPSGREHQIHAMELAVTDSIVRGAMEIQEGLIFQGLSWDSADENTSVLLNQVAEDVDLDAVFRRMSREILVHGMFTAANWWSSSPTRVIATDSAGKPRSKQITTPVPNRISILDISKVVWMSTGPWNTKRYFWQASVGDTIETESDLRLFAGRFEPTAAQAQELIKNGATDTNNLFELNKSAVWTHTTTLPDYMLYPNAPMSSLPALIEMRARLMDADRAALVGAANYVLIIKIGSETLPADDDEIEEAWAGLESIAKLPVIVGDHRLSVEILAPPTDATLNKDKHEAINNIIFCAAFGLPPAFVIKEIDPEILANFIAARLNAHRKGIARALEKNVARAISDRAKSGRFDRASLVFTPREIPLYAVQHATEAILAARQRSEISRETYLDILGLDQSTEARRVKHEQDSGLDDIFGTHEPFDGEQNVPGGPSAQRGGEGGRPTNSRSQKSDTGRSKA